MVAVAAQVLGPVESAEGFYAHVAFIFLDKEIAGEHEGASASDSWQDVPVEDDMVYRAPFFAEFMAADGVAGEAGLPGRGCHQVLVRRGSERGKDAVMGGGVEVSHGQDESGAVFTVQAVHVPPQEAGGGSPFMVGFDCTAVFGGKVADEKVQPDFPGADIFPEPGMARFKEKAFVLPGGRSFLGCAGLFCCAGLFGRSVFFGRVCRWRVPCLEAFRA